MLHYYGVNVTPPHKDREASRPFSICLQNIRFSGAHNAVVIMSHYYGMNVTPPYKDGEAARPSLICLQNIRFSATHNALRTKQLSDVMS
jgi:hypothetical protein